VLDARKDADAWLSLLDAGKIEQAWDRASQYLRSRTTQTDWSGAVGKLRKSLGPLTTRTLISTLVTQRVPAGPPGCYVIIEYRSAFTNKVTVETIAEMISDDNKWQIVGYSLR